MTDEPRGASGYTFAFGDEVDMDRIVRLQPPAVSPRTHGWPLGVSVTAATRIAGKKQSPAPVSAS